MASFEFGYSCEDLVAETAEFPQECESRGPHSKFDQELRARWDTAAEKGYFRYRMGPLATKVIDGPHGFVAQLNIKRGTERRKPHAMQSTKQPFKPEEFNFNKIRPHEIIMELCPKDDCYMNPLQNGTTHIMNGTQHEEGSSTIDDRRGGVKVIINISPLEYGNVLLVPSPELCQPQIATQEMIQIGVEAMLLSSTRDFRLGYNSLCAYASVNHLHMHAYYVRHKIPAEFWPTQEVVPGRCHETIGWPAQGFMLQLRKENYKDVVRDFYMIVKLLQDKCIAHNTFFTRGYTLGPNPRDDNRTVRLILWPRLFTQGAKDGDAINAACCECGGHLPVKIEESYKHLTDEECCKLLEDDSLPPQDYADLKKDVQSLFK